MNHLKTIMYHVDAALKPLEGGYVGEDTLLNVYNEIEEKAEPVFEDIDDSILEYKREISELKEQVQDLKDEIEGIEERNAELEPNSFELPKHLENIVFKSALDSLFENIENIPVSELEEFINRFKK